MKKLSLKNLKLDADDILQRHQLKTIMGGSSSGSCAFQSGNGMSGISGVDRNHAEWGSGQTGGNWCCDSCCDVSWLDESHKTYLGC